MSDHVCCNCSGPADWQYGPNSCLRGQWTCIACSGAKPREGPIPCFGANINSLSARMSLGDIDGTAVMPTMGFFAASHWNDAITDLQNDSGNDR